MRTTIEINDSLMQAVKTYAVHENQSLEETFEQALRAFLANPHPVIANAPPIPVFSGKGVQPGVILTDNEAMQDIMDAES